MKEAIIQWIKGFYAVAGSDGINQELYNQHKVFWALGLFVALIALSTVMWWVSRLFMVQSLHLIADRSKATWDDHLVNNRVFRALAHIVPLAFMEYLLSIVFYEFPKWMGFWEKFIYVLMIFAIIVTATRILNAIRDIIQEIPKFRDKPIQSYVQVAKIIAVGVLIIMMLSIITNRTPVFFLTSLGAMTAIVVLVFKDTILGFVGSIQLAANDIIRIGDWVTMEKYGADGDVEAISLSTVKVRNFDRTITTIPTYAFIADSFKNWRGMEESDGRRIKRSFNIEIDSVRFADQELVNELKSFELLREFIEKRQKEIEDYNTANGFVGEKAINGRRQTNLGLFRRYLEHYLRKHQSVNQEMTLMVRQLQPTEFGIPLEVYCFSKTKVWEEYEVLQADIFDHIFSIVKQFDLVIFERPSGRDFASGFRNEGA